MTKAWNRDADLLLADLLSPQVESTTASELLAEVAEDFGDRRVLAKEFDRALAGALAQERKSWIVEWLSWKPVAIAAAMLLAALGTLYTIDRLHRDVDVRSRVAQSEMRSARSAESADVELEAFQIRFEVLRAAGDFAAAEESAERYLSIAKERYGEQHPKYAKGLNNLAMAYEGLGRDRDAVPLYVRAMAITEKALGSEHPETVRQRAELARLQARLAQARDTSTRPGDGAELIAVFRGHGEPVEKCDFSLDGKQLVTGSDATLRVWDVTTGRLATELTGHASGLLSLAFAADGEVVAAYSDGTILRWGREGRIVPDTLPSYLSGSRTLAATGTARLIAAEDHTVKLFEHTSEIAVLQGHKGPLSGATFSVDARRAATTSEDQTLRVWDVVTGRPLSVLRGQATTPLSAAFSPDGRLIASTGRGDASVYVWDAQIGVQTAILRGHAGPVLSAAFNPSGTQLATTSEDGTARLWSVPSGRPLALLKGHEGPVTSAAFSADGRLVATASKDQTARVWRVPLDETDLRRP